MARPNLTSTQQLCYYLKTYVDRNKAVEGKFPMVHDTIRLSIPFSSLVDAISELEIEDKQRLLGMLEEEINELEEAAWETDEVLQSELQQARVEYDRGDFVSIEQ